MNEPAPAYRSYVIRCWATTMAKPEHPPRQRFIVETISGEPHRRGFDSLAELIAFLQTELMSQEVTQPANDP